MRGNFDSSNGFIKLFFAYNSSVYINSLSHMGSESEKFPKDCWLTTCKGIDGHFPVMPEDLTVA